MLSDEVVSVKKCGFCCSALTKTAKSALLALQPCSELTVSTHAKTYGQDLRSRAPLDTYGQDRPQHSMPRPPPSAVEASGFSNAKKNLIEISTLKKR